MKVKVDLVSAVDRLGELNAAIATLEKEKAALREVVVASGETAVDGDLFRATVSFSTVERIDYAAVVAGFPKSVKLTRLLKSHTSFSERTTLRVVSR